MARAKEGSAIRLLGYDQNLKWQQTSNNLTIQMPEELQDETKRPCQQAYVFKVESKPWDSLEAILPAEPAR